MKNTFALLMLLICVACNSSEKKQNGISNQQQQFIEQLQNTIALYPDSAALRMKLVMVYDSLQLYKKAIVQTDSLIAKDSLNNGLWFTRAQLQEDSGDTSGAIASYKTAVNIYPSVEAQLSLANLLAENRNPEAVLICDYVKKMGMGREVDANCNFISGVYYARTGNADKALQLFDNAIKDNYTLMEAYMEKGFLFYDKKEFKQAQQVFTTAITVDNLYADAYYWRAKTEEAMRNITDALLDYQRAYGLDKANSQAADAIKRLQ